MLGLFFYCNSTSLSKSIVPHTDKDYHTMLQKVRILLVSKLGNRLLSLHINHAPYRSLIRSSILKIDPSIVSLSLYKHCRRTSTVEVHGICSTQSLQNFC